MAPRISATPARNAASSRELVHASCSGPFQAGPGHGRAGRTWANRAHTAGPSKGTTTAQNPDESRAVTLEAGVGLGANPIYQFGTEEQRQTWLPDLCAGRALGGFGLTEPEAGSDAGGTRTTARLDEAADEWVLDGEKAFITNSGTPITSIVTITAK